MFKEFREFAVKGNVLDMAIGIIIGGAFGKIVTSLVNDVVMPPIGLILGRVDFNDLFFSLDRKTYASLALARAAGAPTINYGIFINNILDFTIVAFVMFLIVRQYNRVRPPADPTTKECPYCLSQIAVKASRCPHCTSEMAAA